MEQAGDSLEGQVLAYPIDLACKHEWGLDVIEMMLDAGAAQQLIPAEGNVNEHRREFPMLLAAHHGNAAMMRLLLEKGGDEQVNLVDHEGHNALYFLCMPKNRYPDSGFPIIPPFDFENSLLECASLLLQRSPSLDVNRKGLCHS